MPFLLILFTSVFIAIIGFYYKKPSAAWLTGYKITPPKERENIDWDSYTRLFGNTAIVIAILLTFGWLVFNKLMISKYFDEYVFPSLIGILAISKTMIFYYFNNNKKQSKKNN